MTLLADLLGQLQSHLEGTYRVERELGGGGMSRVFLAHEIAQQYHGLLDVKFNRVHAGVILTHPPDDELSKQITEQLARAIGKEVRAHFRADRAILGGIVVRVGDRIFDGSMRRKLNVLRRKMLTGE